jgi:hypothetical protein
VAIGTFVPYRNGIAAFHAEKDHNLMGPENFPLTVTAGGVVVLQGTPTQGRTRWPYLALPPRGM